MNTETILNTEEDKLNATLEDKENYKKKWEMYFWERKYSKIWTSSLNTHIMKKKDITEKKSPTSLCKSSN